MGCLRVAHAWGAPAMGAALGGQMRQLAHLLLLGFSICILICTQH